MVILAVAVHPFASVTVIVYVPAENPVPVALVPPIGVHAYVYGLVPPPPVTVALPLLPPLHNTLVDAPMVAVSKVG